MDSLLSQLNLQSDAISRFVTDMTNLSLATENMLTNLSEPAKQNAEKAYTDFVGALSTFLENFRDVVFSSVAAFKAALAKAMMDLQVAIKKGEEFIKELKKKHLNDDSKRVQNFLTVLEQVKSSIQSAGSSPEVAESADSAESSSGPSIAPK